MAKLQLLIKQVETCRLCPLCRSRHQAVPGEGNESATVLLIGEGPGYHEDREGRPFIGPAGQFLDELLALAGLDRAGVYITNVVKCRPPNNRDPLPDEIAACAPYLDRQIATINPQVIVTLGRYSMARFVNETSISRIHGQAWDQDGRLVVTMYHPAAGLHNGSLKEVIRDDFRKLPGYIQQAQGRPAPPPVETRPALATAPSAAALALLDTYALELATAAATAPVPTAAPSSPLARSVAVAERPEAVAAPIAAAPIEPATAVKRGRGRKPGATNTPVVASDSVPEPAGVLAQAQQAEVEQEPVWVETTVPTPLPTEPIAAALEPAPAAPPAPPEPGRKKDKPAPPPVEQLSFF